MLATLLWQVWFVRNELCFEKIYSSPEVCFKRARDGLKDYQRWNGTTNPKKICRDKAKWCKPHETYIKINFDAALNNQKECYGLGIVARDSSGRVLLAAAQTQWPLISAEMAEIKAADWAVRMAIEQRWNKAIIEGDAAVVIEALNQKRVRGFHA